MPIPSRSFWLTAMLATLSFPAAAANGDTDPGFGDGGAVYIDATSTATYQRPPVAVQTDGKILVCGSDTGQTGTATTGYVYRLNADGSTDTDFGSDGRTTLYATTDPPCAGILQTHDGKIVVVSRGYLGYDVETRLARYAADGDTLDDTFGDAGLADVNLYVGSADYATAIAEQPDGAIVLGIAAVPNRFVLARVRTDGTLDTDFGGSDHTVTIQFPTTDWSYQPILYGVAVDGAGRIVVSGGVPTATQGIHAFAVARVLADGTPDTTFGEGGELTLGFTDRDAMSTTLMLQRDGRIVLGGWAATYDATAEADVNYDVAVARLNTDGSLDGTFAGGGQRVIPLDFSENGTDAAFAGLIRRDGTIVLVGRSDAESAYGDSFMMQLDGDGNDKSDFGTNGVRLYPPSSDWDGQTFAGIALQGSDYIVRGSAVHASPFRFKAVVTRIEGASSAVGHSGHANPGHPPIN